jgi:ectoine hydroxylase-related dioxygenase (phytanoyl-CoA dioxygenase family)
MGILTTDEVERFHRDGYLVVSRPILSAAQIQRLRDLILPLFATLDRLPEEWVHDLGTPSPEGTTSIHEVIFTAEVDPRIRLTSAYRAIRAVAGELIGAPATLNFDHAILKPAHSTATTPWHQDLAFNADDETTANFWVPLVDITPAIGCMRYIPGSHRAELFTHESRGRDALQAMGVDESDEVLCPVPVGGFTVHGQRTLHSTGANTTDTDRPTWTVKFKADERSRAQQLSERTRTVLRAARRTLRAPGRPGETADHT